MDKLDNLIRAAEIRGATERELIAVGREIAHSVVQMDETGTLATAEQICADSKIISDIIR